MLHQKFNVGQQVRSNKDSELIYTVITSEPVFQKTPVAQKLKTALISRKLPKEIINYKYRCKSKVDMQDFMQEDLLSA